MSQGVAKRRSCEKIHINTCVVQYLSMIYTILGLISALIFIGAYIPYFRDTLNGDTRPQRVTWGVLFLINIINVANQIASGADDSLWFFYATAFITGLVFVLSISKGVGGHSKVDIFSLCGVLVGVLLWQSFDSSLLSVFVNVVIYVISLVPTFKKVKDDPESETNITWLLGAISTLFAFASVGSLEIELILLPISGIVMQGLMSYLLYFRLKEHRPVHQHQK